MSRAEFSYRTRYNAIAVRSAYIEWKRRMFSAANRPKQERNKR